MIKVKALRKLYDIIFLAVEAFAVIFMLGMVGIAIYSVFMRYVMHNAPRWGDELAAVVHGVVWLFKRSSSLKGGSAYSGGLMESCFAA